jgi:V8-like Glu-specific endopeptidase
MKIGTWNILRHNLRTQSGDSGTPLLVQPKELLGRCLVISIHASYNEKKDRRSSVRFTRKAVDYLADLERTMRNSS